MEKQSWSGFLPPPSSPPTSIEFSSHELKEKQSPGFLHHPFPAVADQQPSLRNRATSLAPGAGYSLAEVFALQGSSISDGFLPPEQFVRAFSNFKKSGAPSRFFVFCKGDWLALDHQVFDELRKGFLSGKTTLEVMCGDGKAYLFDFLRMLRIDVDTRGQNSIAWIDVHGRCYFPANAVDEIGNRANEKIDLGLRLGSSLLMPSQQPRPPEFHGEDTEVSSHRWPDTRMLGEDEKFCKVVEKLFLYGIKRFVQDAGVTCIHRCSHSTPSGKSRLLSFQLHKRATLEARGRANVKFGWYGTSAVDIATIMSYGFRQPNNKRLGSCAHGVGIHLSPPDSPFLSAALSEADENGEKHVILCRVIMGNSEEVEAGSTQDHPSNVGFDSGVDQSVNPKWYVVWSTHMNTHIIPEYIVSFKSSGHSHGSRKSLGVQKSSAVRKLPFPKLFVDQIEKSLPFSKSQALEILYNRYKVGKISKETFVTHLRSITGDDLLAYTLKRFRANGN